MSDILPISVLLVDDEIDTQRPWLRGVIEECLPNVEIVEAASWAEARQIIDNCHPFMAAVVDLCLPNEAAQEGLNVLSYLQQRQPNCYRILVTKSDERGIRDRSPVQSFVSIHYTRTSRRTMLIRALAEAQRQFWRQQESQPEPAAAHA